jgi:hypothetical protein
VLCSEYGYEFEGLGIAVNNETEVIQGIRHVLDLAAKGKGAHPQYITAYQILDRLPKVLRASVIAQHGDSGEGAKSWSSAAKYIANLIKGMGGVERSYLDTRGVEFRIGDEKRRAGYKVCGLYRLSRP